MIRTDTIVRKFARGGAIVIFLVILGTHCLRAILYRGITMNNSKQNPRRPDEKTIDTLISIVVRFECLPKERQDKILAYLESASKPTDPK